MKKLATFCLFTALITVVFGAVFPVLAQNPPESPMGRLEAVGTAAGVSTTTTLETTIGFIINVVLSLIGVIMVVLIIYGGFMWMTAAGEPKKVEKAKDILQAAIIGLVIVLAAYAIARFVVEKLIFATQ